MFWRSVGNLSKPTSMTFTAAHQQLCEKLFSAARMEGQAAAPAAAAAAAAAAARLATHPLVRYTFFITRPERLLEPNSVPPALLCESTGRQRRGVSLMRKLRAVIMTALVAVMVLARAWAINMHAHGGPGVRGSEKPDLGRFHRSGGFGSEEGDAGGGLALQLLPRGAGVRGSSQQRWLGRIPNPVKEFAALVDRTKVLFGFVRKWTPKAFANVLRRLLSGRLLSGLPGRLRGWWGSKERGKERCYSVAPIRYERRWYDS